MPGAFLVLLFTGKVGEELRNIVSLRRQKKSKHCVVALYTTKVVKYNEINCIIKDWSKISILESIIEAFYVFKKNI